MGKRCYWIITLLLAISLQACSTPYQKLGYRGGYSETALDENVFKVSFQGNKKTSRERAWDFALLRSAELTLERGYLYFIVMDNSYYEKLGTYRSPTFVVGTNMVVGGHSIVTTAPSSTNLIACFYKKPENVFSYSARFIYEEITSKYGIEKTLSNALDASH